MSIFDHRDHIHLCFLNLKSHSNKHKETAQKHRAISLSVHSPYQVLNGGDPGGAFTINSVSGITYAIATTINMITIQRPQRSVK